VTVTDGTWKSLDRAINGSFTNPEPSGWHLPGFDDSGWAAALVVDLEDSRPFYDLFPAAIPGASFITDPAIHAGLSFAGDSIGMLRKSFTLGVTPTAAVTLYVNCDNWCRVWVNDHLAIEFSPPLDNWSTVTEVSIPAAWLDAGENVIAVALVNDGNSPNPGEFDPNPTFVQALLDLDCPFAAFTAVPTSGGIPLTVAFTDLSSGNPTGWAWDFGDGGTSTEQNPSHVYTVAGLYTVELVVSSSGCDDSTSVRADYIAAATDCRPMLFDIYRLGVPSGDPTELVFVATLCEAFDQWIALEELDTGSGGLTINRYGEDATVAVLGDGQADVRLAKVRIPDIQTAPLFAVFLETGDFRILSGEEEGGEDLTFQGLGALSYLGRAAMATRAYLRLDAVPPAFALPDPVDGVWHFERPDYASSLAFLASAANGTGSLVSSWQLPAISPTGDDVLLLAFLQVRPNEDVTLAAGWTERASQDTALGGDELRYILADKIEATEAAPYDDTFTSAAPARWTAAQLAFRSTGVPTGEFGTAYQAESTPEGVITATLSGLPTAGNMLVCYATETTDGAGVISYVFPDGWTLIQRIPNANHYTGYAAVAYKPADGTETDVEVTIRVAGGSNLTSTVLLVAEYPILYAPLKAGEILYMILAELLATERPVNPVPILTLNFTFELDSNGDPWDETPSTAQFTARVTENVLDPVRRLLATGALVLVMDPDLTLHAYNRSTYGRDLTGGAFGAGIVRLEAGVGIASELRRDRQIPRAATHAWVAGDDDSSGFTSLPDAASRVTREVGVVASGTSDGAALIGIGDDELAGRLERSERVSLGLALGFDELAGFYVPGPDGSNGHLWLGDSVTADTGASPFDYVDEPFRVAAITFAEPTGPDAAVTKATDLESTIRLGSNMDPRTDVGSGGGGSGGGSGGSGGGGTITNLTSYQLRSEKGQPDGYASIDTDGHVPPSELGTGAAGLGALGLRDDKTWQPVATPTSTPVDHGNMGATEAIDAAASDWHIGVLDTDVTLTVSGFVLDEGLVVLLRVTQDGTGGHAITQDVDVVFAGPDQPAQAPGAVTWFAYWSDEGDGTIYGAILGGAGAVYDLPALTLGTAAAEGAAESAIRTDATLPLFDDVDPTTAAFDDVADPGVALFAARSDHLHGMPAEPAGGTGTGRLLLASDHSTPIVFDDILQASDGSDFLYASE